MQTTNNTMEVQSQDHFSQLRLLEQNLSSLLSQKSELQDALLEVESALRDLDSSKVSYKLVGKLMIAQDSSKVDEQLQAQKKMYELQLTTVEAQEEKLQEKMAKIQKSFLDESKKTN